MRQRLLWIVLSHWSSCKSCQINFALSSGAVFRTLANGTVSTCQTALSAALGKIDAVRTKATEKLKVEPDAS
jgi:hypothetical protein